MLGIGLRWGVLDFDFIFVVEGMDIGARRHTLALYFLQEEFAVLHGAEQAPQGTAVDGELVTRLRIRIIYQLLG